MVWGAIKDSFLPRRYNNNLLPQHPPTKNELRKIRAATPKTIPLTIDHEIDFKRILLQIENAIYSDYYQSDKENICFRGKMDFYRSTTDPQTSEKKSLFSISDVRAQFRDSIKDPFLILTDFDKNFLSGSIIEVEIPQNIVSRGQPYYIPSENIKLVDLKKLPILDWDYEKFTKSLTEKYDMRFSDVGQKWKKIGELSNIDFLFVGAVVGENYCGQVKGINTVTVNRPYGIGEGSYQIDVLDDLYSKIVPQPKESGVLFATNMGSGGIKSLKNALSKSRRILEETPFKNSYGYNIGHTLNRGNYKDDDLFAESIESANNLSMDLFNPVNRIQTPTRTQFNREFNRDRTNIYGTKLVFIESQVKSPLVRVKDLLSSNPEDVRVAAAIFKLKEYIYRQGLQEDKKTPILKQDDLEVAKKFRTENRENIIEFIRK